MRSSVQLLNDLSCSRVRSGAPVDGRQLSSQLQGPPLLDCQKAMWRAFERQLACALWLFYYARSQSLPFWWRLRLQARTPNTGTPDSTPLLSSDCNLRFNFFNHAHIISSCIIIIIKYRKKSKPLAHITGPTPYINTQNKTASTTSRQKTECVYSFNLRAPIWNCIHRLRSWSNRR